MPEVKDIQLRDVHVTFSMSLEELRMVHRAISLGEFDKRSKDDPRNLPSVEYMTQVFWPFIDNLVKDAEKYVS